MNKKIEEMREGWKKNYCSEDHSDCMDYLITQDFECRIEEHRNKEYYFEEFSLLVPLIEHSLRKLIMTRNLRLAILLELGNNPILDYSIKFNEKHISLSQLKKTFEQFFGEKTKIINSLKKFIKKRNNLVHFAKDKNLKEKKRLFTGMLNYNDKGKERAEIDNARFLYSELKCLNESEGEEMNNLQKKIDNLDKDK